MPNNNDWTFYCDVWKCKISNETEKIYIVIVNEQNLIALCIKHYDEYYPHKHTKYIIDIKEKENGK